ncbi:hypothetical protein GGX14DRAFT_580632 [Mycena pura]|uniref:Uncharacterized protein n=1 Tax=Mycena pura TaxID=153505 RepID=A0AAD6UKG8_9AGAR|nr:hypothetical protein GGX14DRAFT_580632 [Mycena pura]
MPSLNSPLLRTIVFKPTNAQSIDSPAPLLARSNTSLFSNSSSISSYKSPALPANHASPHQPDAHQEFANDSSYSQPASPSTEQPLDNEARSEDSAMRFVTLPSQPGPHRVVFGAHDSDDLYEIAEPNVLPAPHKARGKRKRAEVDEDADDAHTRTQGFGGPAKRFKAQQPQVPPRVDVDCVVVYLEEVEKPSDPGIVWSWAGVRRGRAGTRVPDLLLKARRVSSRFARSSVDKYMRSAERWRSCSREEWIAGADSESRLHTCLHITVVFHRTTEMAATYTKILDFAKAHMAEKAKLFAQCEGRLQGHGRVLVERDGLLVRVKQRLVEESGDVLSK